MTCGIYKIRNLINGKLYIGQSRDIEKRWKNHIITSKDNNRNNTHLYRAFGKYGIENFVFSIICEVPESSLDEYEISYIKYYETTNPEKGYNMMSGGSNGSHSEVTKKKISDSNKGKKRTIETKQRMSISGKDRQKISEDTRKNMSDASKGRTQTEESRRKQSTPITLDGVEYYSKREAARQLGISNGTLHYRLKHDWYLFLGNV